MTLPGKAPIRAHSSLPPPDMLSAALGRCQNPWGTRVPATHFRPRSGARQCRAAGELQPASWGGWQVIPTHLDPLYTCPGPHACLTLLFPGGTARRLPGHSLELPGAAQGGAVCAGKMLVLRSTERPGSASLPSGGSVGGSADTGS